MLLTHCVVENEFFWFQIMHDPESFLNLGCHFNVILFLYLGCQIKTVILFLSTVIRHKFIEIILSLTI